MVDTPYLGFCKQCCNYHRVADISSGYITFLKRKYVDWGRGDDFGGGQTWIQKHGQSLTSSETLENFVTSLYLNVYTCTMEMVNN